MAELLKRIDMALFSQLANLRQMAYGQAANAIGTGNTGYTPGFTGLQGAKTTSGGYAFGPNVGKNVADWTSPLSQARPSGRSMYDPMRREEWLLRQERMAARGGQFPNMRGAATQGVALGDMRGGINTLKPIAVQTGVEGNPNMLRVRLEGMSNDPMTWATINKQQWRSGPSGRLYQIQQGGLQRAAAQALFD